MRSKSVFTAMILACAAGASVARAEQKYTFVQKAAVGQSWSVDDTMSLTLDINAGGQNIAQSTASKRGADVGVTAVKGDGPSAVKIKFAEDCATTAKQNGQGQDVPFPLAGKTVTLKKDGDGFKVEGEEVDEATTKELGQMMAPDKTLFPKEAVAVGDEWDGDSSTMSKQMSFGPNDKISVKCKLVKIDAVEDRPTFNVSVEISGTKTEDNGLTTKLDMQGTAQIDQATGQVLDAKIGGKMKMSGEVNGTPVTGDGKLELKHVIKPVSGYPTVGTKTGVKNPLVAENPLGGGKVTDAPLAKDDPKYAGDFSGVGLKMHLEFSDGKYTGTMTKGDQKYPVTAKDDGEQLTGTFTAGGKRFEFTAALTNGYMNLRSGNTSFSMAKESINPLDK